ncbi:hypothetical protein C8T65DRAFT_263502 [Cerioporus squamosus]|nr:hypothetical protein C8T65DRAFT_263502 [Cerioporus squamosus]
MFSRRVTRSVTRAAAATTNNAPVAPPAPPAPAAAPNQTQTTVDNKPPPLRTRSGRVVRQIASTVQKLTGGRRGRKAAEQELVESQASTSTAPARPQTTAPPPRKRPARMLLQHPHLQTTLPLRRPQPPPLLHASVPQRNSPPLRHAVAQTRARPRLPPPFPSPRPRHRGHLPIPHRPVEGRRRVRCANQRYQGVQPHDPRQQPYQEGARASV